MVKKVFSLYFLGLILFALILFCLIACIGRFGIKNLFPKLGKFDAASTASSFSGMMRTYGQITIGLVVILALVALILEGKVSSETAMPIISLISGYILGTSIETRLKDKN